MTSALVVLALIAAAVVIAVLLSRSGARSRAAAPHAHVGTSGQSGTGINLTLDSQTAEIERPYFLGSYAQSPDGRFTIIWADASSEAASTTMDGPKVRGNYVLIDGRRIVRTGRVEEPECGSVADNGTFALASTLDTAELASRLRVFSSDGAVLLSRRFGALPMSMGISPSGRFVAYQVANSDHPRDGGRLTIIDVARRQTLLRKNVYSNWAESFKFEPDDHAVLVEYRSGGSERFELRTGSADVHDNEHDATPSA